MWIALAARAKAPISGSNTPGRPGPSPDTISLEPFKGLTRQEVLERLGKPDSIARVATQGRLREQWVYRRVNRTLYINFVQSPDLPRAVVVALHD